MSASETKYIHVEDAKLFTYFLVTIFLPLLYFVEVEDERKFPPTVGPVNDVLENEANLKIQFISKVKLHV